MVFLAAFNCVHYRSGAFYLGLFCFRASANVIDNVLTLVLPRFNLFPPVLEVGGEISIIEADGDVAVICVAKVVVSGM